VAPPLGGSLLYSPDEKVKQPNNEKISLRLQPE